MWSFGTLRRVVHGQETGLSVHQIEESCVDGFHENERGSDIDCIFDLAITLMIESVHP